jgi:hypothetical protein
MFCRHSGWEIGCENWSDSCVFQPTSHTPH